jgi:hypothetical protein
VVGLDTFAYLEVIDMYELTGKITGVSFTFDGLPLIALQLNERQNALAMLDELKSLEKLTVKLDKFKVKRSLDANAYAWLLIGKIAEKTGVAKEDVYRSAIRNVGGNYEIVCVQDKALESLCQLWQRNGIGWVTETMPSKIEGCTNVFLYYGSSCFSVEQMKVFTDFIKQDCYALGIETKSQAEIDSLLNNWGN